VTRIDRCRCALPVVDVEHVRRLPRERRLRERRKAHVVVAELAGAAGSVQRAGSIVERRALDEAVQHATDAHGPHADLELVRADVDRDRRSIAEREPGGVELGRDAAVQRHAHGDVEPVTLCERGGQAGDHIG
jgi:hypothetical protein